MKAEIPPTAAPVNLAAALSGLLARLAGVLERENADLRGNDLSRFAEHARQKDLLHLDIARLAHSIKDDAGHDQTVARQELERVKGLLAENARLLDVHLGATREFAGYVEDAIRNSASDGTYTRDGLAGRRDGGGW